MAEEHSQVAPVMYVVLLLILNSLEISLTNKRPKKGKN